MYSWHCFCPCTLALIREPKANLSDHQRTPFPCPVPLVKVLANLSFRGWSRSHSFVYTELILRETLRYPDIKHQWYHLGNVTLADQFSEAEANITERGNEVGLLPLPCLVSKTMPCKHSCSLANELDYTK